MSDRFLPIDDLNVLSFARQRGINDQEIRRRLEHVGFGPDDAAKIISLREVVTGNAEALASVFFDHLATLEGTSALLDNPATLKRARDFKVAHLKAMVSGEYGEAYAGERLQLGLLYFQSGLEADAFLGAFHHLMLAVGFRVMEGTVDSPSRGFDTFLAFMAFMKIAFFDIGLIIDTLVFEHQRIISRQEESIRELSTPVLKLGETLLVLPLVGLIDMARANQLRTNLLDAVRRQRARYVVIDITGVPVIDSTVSFHLAHVVQTTALMGARTVLTGLSAEAAKSLVELGVDLTKLETYATLQDGVEAVRPRERLKQT